jgi:hypothetical protein
MAYDIAGGFITALRSYFPTTALREQLTRADVSSGAAAPA